jgi:hypothetical protein
MWSRPLVTAPGTRYAYANFNYCLLGRVIEHFPGSYANYVAETVLQPFGMNATFLATHLLSDRRAGEARYYPYPGEPQVDSVFAPGTVDSPYGGFDIENMDSHGGWVSSPIDLLAFMNGVFGGSFIDTSMITAPTNAIQIGTSSSFSGLGWIFTTDAKGFTFSFGGSLPGTSSVVVRTPWPSGAEVSWAAVMNIRSGGRTAGPAAVGNPFVSVFGQQQHFAWRDGNGTIWDAWYDAADGHWNPQELNIDLQPKPSGKTNAPLAGGDPFVSVSGAQQHFAYRDQMGGIWDVWFDSGSGLWTPQQINTGMSGLTNGPAAAGDPFVSVFGDQQHFVYRDADGAIWDAWFNGDNGTWNIQRINAGADGKTFAPPAVADPFVSVFGQQQHFAYRADGGAIWDAWFNGANDTWNQQQITAGGVTAGPPAAGNPFVSVLGQQQHFVYADAFGVLWDAWFDGGDGTWKLQQVNAGGQTTTPLITAAGVAFVDAFQQQQHFAYRDDAGAIWDVWYDSGTTTWSQQRLTAGGRTNGPAAVGDPFISFFEQQQHFAYADAVGNVWDAWYDETNKSWNLQQITAQNRTTLTDALDKAMWDAMNTISDAIASFATIP